MAPNDRCEQDSRSRLRAGRGGSHAATLPAAAAEEPDESPGHRRPCHRCAEPCPGTLSIEAAAADCSRKSWPYRLPKFATFCVFHSQAGNGHFALPSWFLPDPLPEAVFLPSTFCKLLLDFTRIFFFSVPLFSRS